ncbi:cilia- and flagella-associated protein 53-like [Heteronotia binoei]|uniref:cilia- and flagella-associated protein 53-like n=1 Tax=Heteronotia binoei TaxID=13085 RepID=UPI002930F17B|nr:cilia- and flagella-associated protein 53-like [Heteronotia binoei]
MQDRDAELVQQQEAMQQQAKKLKQDAEEMIEVLLLWGAEIGTQAPKSPGHLDRGEENSNCWFPGKGIQLLYCYLVSGFLVSLLTFSCPWLQMRNSLLQEQKKWEADTKVALQIQRQTLEEVHQKMWAELQETLEKERRSCLALQVKTDSLHKRIQELETQAQLLQGEKSTALEELRALLQEEKTQALSRQQKELEQERVQERNQMRARVQQMEVDQRVLQAELRGASFWGQGNQTHTEWTDGSLAREVTSACQQLLDLLPKQASMSRLSRMLPGIPSDIPGLSSMVALRFHSCSDFLLPLPRSSAFLSSSHALQGLREVSEAIQRYLWDLKQEIETLKHNILQIQREKEQQLRQQQKQLRLESQLNLEVLKDHVVQEHLKDIAALQRSWWEKSTGEMHALRKQLREKDEELRAIQRNMACWKDKMASKLAHKFQAQLEAELEQCLAKDKSTDFFRNLETTESEISFPCMHSLCSETEKASVASTTLANTGK